MDGWMSESRLQHVHVAARACMTVLGQREKEKTVKVCVRERDEKERTACNSKLLTCTLLNACCEGGHQE